MGACAVSKAEEGGEGRVVYTVDKHIILLGQSTVLGQSTLLGHIKLLGERLSVVRTAM